MHLLYRWSVALCVIASALYSNAAETIRVDNDKYNITYDVVNNETIIFELSAETKGWIAIGFNPENATMLGSDIFMGIVRLFNNWTLPFPYDCHLAWDSETRQPKVDVINNWSVPSASETNRTDGKTITQMTISRKLDTGDKNDLHIKNQTIYLLWAYNSQTDDLTVPHTSNGVVQVNLICPTCVEEPPENTDPTEKTDPTENTEPTGSTEGPPGNTTGAATSQSLGIIAILVSIILSIAKMF